MSKINENLPILVSFISFDELVESISERLLDKVKSHIRRTGLEYELPQRLSTAKEVSAFLGVSAPTLTRWRNNGKIPHLLVGNSIRYDIVKVLKALEWKPPNDPFFIQKDLPDNHRKPKTKY